MSELSDLLTARNQRGAVCCGVENGAVSWIMPV